MCSSSEAGTYLRLMDFVFHSSLGSRVIQKKEKCVERGGERGGGVGGRGGDEPVYRAQKERSKVPRS